jgi:hypothetical protein
VTATNHVDEFEIDGVGFRLKPLPVLVAEKLAPALSELVTPALAGIFANQKSITDLAQSLRGLAGVAEQLPKFREAFAAQCQVTIGEVGGQRVWSELKGNAFEDTFRRKHRLYFEWLARCLGYEFGDFLAEIGRKLAAALKESLSTFQPGSPGESGDSPPTPESKTDTPT